MYIVRECQGESQIADQAGESQQAGLLEEVSYHLSLAG